MKKMTPREALYNIIIELGPVPETNRDDNLSPKEQRLRDSVRALQNFIDYHDDTKHRIPDSANEYRTAFVQRPVNRGDGKERLDNWRKELPPLSREDFIE